MIFRWSITRVSATLMKGFLAAGSIILHPGHYPIFVKTSRRDSVRALRNWSVYTLGMLQIQWLLWRCLRHIRKMIQINSTWQTRRFSTLPWRHR